MEFLLHRYRNQTVLLAAILAQLALLAYQVKSDSDVRLIRVWAMSAVTPLARVIETARGSAVHFFRDYFVLLDVREDNQRLKADLDYVKMENQFLRSELSTADRAHALALFQQQSQSKTIAAHVIGNTTAVGAKVVIIDRGTGSGVQKGMAVITPDGIVGKVTGAYPTASYVLLVTDPSFAAGVLSQKHRIHGTLKGQGYGTVLIDYVQSEQKVEPGEWFYTSGDDRIFPKGLPVGEVSVVRPGKAYQQIFVTPSGMRNGLEEVLVVIEGLHGAIPDNPPGFQPVHMQDPPPAEPGAEASVVLPGAPSVTQVTPARSGPQATDADKMIDRYRQIGEAERRVYGQSGGGAPNFNIHLPPPAPETAAPPASPSRPSPSPSAKRP